MQNHDQKNGQAICDGDQQAASPPGYLQSRDLFGRAMPDAVEGDVVAATELVVDGAEGCAGHVVLQIEDATGLLAVVIDVEEWPHGDGVATDFSRARVLCKVCVVRAPFHVNLSVTFRAARENQAVASGADVAVRPGSEPLLRGDGGRGRHRCETVRGDPAGPSSHRCAGPSAVCYRGCERRCDEVTLVNVGFRRIKVLGMARCRCVAFVTAVEEHKDRCSAVEDTQATEIECHRRLALHLGYIGREWSIVSLRNRKRGGKRKNGAQADGP